MAEYLLRHGLGPRLDRWTIASAGVSAPEGAPASEEAVMALRERGVDLAPHRSRGLTAELVDAAALIVVMTDLHRAVVQGRYPRAAGKVHLLRSFDSRAGHADLEDPIGLSLDAYRAARDQIEAALPDLMLFMHEHDGGRGRRGKDQA